MNTFSIYKRMPIWAQNFLCSIQGYRLDKQRYGKEYSGLYENLLQSDFWDEPKILNYKEEQIHRILDYVYKHCPYYHKKYKAEGLTPNDFKGMDSLVKFPILTKEEVRCNWLGMVSDEYQLKDLIMYHTSGSTGKALDFYWSKYSLQYYWAIVWRGRNRFGINKGDCHINFTGKIVVPIEQKLPPFWRYNYFLNQYMLNMQHMSKDKVKYIVDFINNSDYNFFVGYPSIIYAFADLIKEQDLLVTHSPKYIFSSAEKMYDFQQMLIENVFKDTRVVEHYGFSENAGAASKCGRDVYHEDFELGHLELSDTTKTNVGLCGNLLATGFQNLAMPFIRYDIGDTATFSEEKCICGRHSQVIVDIEGRNGDYVLTPEGAKIMRFGYIFKETSDIKESQIVQRELGSMVIRIVKRPNYNTEMEKKIVSAVREWISPTIKVDFEYVDEIPRTKAGKFRAVISELNIKK